MLIFTFAIMIASVVIDQITKRLAVTYLEPVGSVPLIQDVLHLTYVENTGAAFGILKNNRWIFMTLSVVFIIALLGYLIKFRPRHPLMCTALGMIIGGGIGNMIDRFAYGYVVDFIDFTLIDFAVFNGADSFVCVGAVLFAIYILWFDETKEKSDGKEISSGKHNR